MSNMSHGYDMHLFIIIINFCGSYFAKLYIFICVWALCCYTLPMMIN
jgi:hypothetical protein